MQTPVSLLGDARPPCQASSILESELALRNLNGLTSDLTQALSVSWCRSYGTRNLSFHAAELLFLGIRFSSVIPFPYVNLGYVPV